MARDTAAATLLAETRAKTSMQVELPIAAPSKAVRPALIHRQQTARATRWTLDRRQIERARIIANMTYQQLAAAAHIDRATLSDMLGGRRDPTLGSVHAVIRTLGLDPAAVLVFK
jgi:DNA-binding XRE family transcriptional regulator